MATVRLLCVCVRLEPRELGPGHSELLLLGFKVKTDSFSCAMPSLSSFRLSRSARPPCRRSSPETDLLKVVLVGAGLAGGRLKLYKLLGAFGSTGLLLLAADDNGKW